MASDDSFDLETDLLSLQFDSNIQALHSGLVSTQEAAKSEKRKCESDSSSSSDSDETESISSNVEHFQHLSVDDEDHAQTKSNDAEDVANTIFNTCFSDEDKDGDTPLHILTIFQETYKLLCFLNLCSDSKLHDLINKRNKLGQTALHIATFLQDTEMIECLLYTGADPGVQDIHGRTILHILAENGACQMLKTLAGIFEQKDFDVEYSGSRRRLTEIRNYDGFTPLHIATLNNDRNMITLLLSLGACPKMAEGRSGRTALHMAGVSWVNVARFYNLNLYI